jgi:hypothetical protein
MSTIIIHGTLARESPWWLVPKRGGFLDALAMGMREGDREPDIWRIGGRSVAEVPELYPRGAMHLLTGWTDPPFDQVDGHYRWPGNNAHEERLREGVRLARYLEALARVSPNETIDVVAHSHGCNVVKIATAHIASHVRLGCAVFLAAPHCEDLVVGKRSQLYPLNAARLAGGNRRASPVLNVYSEEDTVQTTIADHAPDFYGAPPGIAPVFDAHRCDRDPRTRSAYDDLELPTRMGRESHVHGALHGPTVGRLVGYWLARWPALSGATCLRHLGIAIVTDPDTG